MKAKRTKVKMLLLSICIIAGVGVGCVQKSEENHSADQRAESQVTETADTGEGHNDTENAQENPVEVSPAAASPTIPPWEIETPEFVTGKCGEDAVWSYDTHARLLQVTGTGVVDRIINSSDIYVTDSGEKKHYRVKEIQIGEGITALDAGPVFLNVSKAKDVDEIKVSLPDSLEKIGTDTFDPS